jgi:hypothetical protein
MINPALRLLFACILTAGLPYSTAAAAQPEPPKFGKPGEMVFSAVVPLKKPKKTADRTEGGMDHVFFTLWIPAGLKSVRGIYHTPFNLDTVEKAQSRAMASHWGFALVGGNLMRVAKDEFASSLITGVRDLATQSGHAELNDVPFIFSSMSAGVGMCLGLAEQLPERTLACGLVCLEAGPESDRTRDVPMMSIFGERDGRQMEQLQELLPKRRSEWNASWAIATQWGRKHEWAQANNLLWPFFDEVIRQRLPLEPSGSAVKLRPCDPARVCLGDPQSWTDRAAAAAFHQDYKGDKSAACWLPSESVASVWQAFVVPKPLLRIVSPAPQGDGKALSIFAAGSEVYVSIECPPAFAGRTLALRDCTKPLLEAVVKNGKAELAVRGLTTGFHTLIATASDEAGKKELSRPVTILVSSPVKSE